MRPRPEPGPRPLLTALRRPEGPVRHHVYAVHPGALPATVWNTPAAALPEGIALSLLDLQNVPEYFAAAFTRGGGPARIEDLAARCLAAVAAVHPGGDPYSLAGWSFGGVVAFDLARQAAGHPALGRPTELVLLDSIAPVPAYQRGDDLLEPDLLLGWFAMYLGAKRERPLRWTPSGAPDGLADLLAATVRQGVLPADTELPGFRKLYDTYVAGLLRNNRYTLPYRGYPLDLEITLIKPEQSLLPDSGDLGWTELSTLQLRRASVAGDHYTMLHRPSSLSVLTELLAQAAAA